MLWPARIAVASAVGCALAVSGPSVSAVPSASAAVSRPAAATRVAHARGKKIPGGTAQADNRDSHYCDGCVPPLEYGGGPVADTSGNGVTITPVYWIPAATTPYPAGYESLINQYVNDIAADSGGTDSVFSVLTQYYSEDSNGNKTDLHDSFQAGNAIVDTQPFPANGCTPDQDHNVCLTDAQLQTELARLQAADNLNIGLANFYPLFTAPDVETFDTDGTNSVSGFCGYHSGIGSGDNEMFYGNEVFEAQGCGEGSSPNNNVPADSAISTLSHEISEFMTDPEASSAAWNSSDGSEVGDICANDYGVALGSTDSSNSQTTEYNQVINGDKYYTQTEFSNSAYASRGKGFGCQQSTTGSAQPATPAPSANEQLFLDATPNAVDADGSSTSQVEFTVADANGDAVSNDKVQFSEYAVSGTGSCGTMKQQTATTDDGGYISDDYEASTSNVVCAIVAKDSTGGKSATVEVYQGTTQSSAPSAGQTFPASMISGQTVTFTNTFKNQGTKPLNDPTFDLAIFQGDKTKTNVDSSQTTLAYSLTGPSGDFTSIPLTGSTVNDGGISTNWTPPVEPAIAPGASMVITYKFYLAPRSAAGIANNDLLSFEGYLEQENLAAGTTTTVADTFSSDVNVSDSSGIGGSSAGGGNHQASSSGDNAAASGSGSAVIGGVVIVAILAVASGAVILLLRRRRSRPAGATPGGGGPLGPMPGGWGPGPTPQGGGPGGPSPQGDGPVG
jgi:hypothetical protein